MVEENDLSRLGNSIADGKLGKSDNEPKIESPVEEARRLNKELQDTYSKISEERVKLEKLHSDLIIGGRSFAGQQAPKELTPEEKVKQLADQTVKNFLGVK